MTVKTMLLFIKNIPKLPTHYLLQVAVGVHWTKHDYTQAERYYHTLSTLPAVYQHQEDESSLLPRAIHDVFRVRIALGVYGLLLYIYMSGNKLQE